MSPVTPVGPTPVPLVPESYCGALRVRTLVLGLLVLCSCGDGEDDRAHATGGLRALAYVVTECAENPARPRDTLAKQRLEVRVGDTPARVLASLPTIGPLPPIGLCPLFSEVRFGPGSGIALPFQRLGVSPDAETVVFEITDDVSVLAPVFRGDMIPPAEEGIFAIGTDGDGLRYLGAASREPAFRFEFGPDGRLNAGSDPLFSFSPRGDRLAFTDRGPGPDGSEAPQVFTLDIETGTRTQITQLPAFASINARTPPVNLPSFVDDITIAFATASASAGVRFHTVRADGKGELTTIAPPADVRGSRFVGDWALPGLADGVLLLSIPGTPENFVPGVVLFESITEIFLQAAGATVQLTAFRRADTGIGRGRLLDRTGRHLLFMASADPIGLNPLANCQLFSLDVENSELTQLTSFSDGEHSESGCAYLPMPGCAATLVGFEPSEDTVIFYSSCDPFGTNERGGELFSIRTDGSNLRQLTHTRGTSVDELGTATAELPGPVAYPEP